MKIRPIFILAAVLASSSVIFSLLDRFDSTAASVSMIVLATIDFASILYFFRGQRYIGILSSTRIIDVVTSVIVILFCLIGALVG